MSRNHPRRLRWPGNVLQATLTLHRFIQLAMLEALAEPQLHLRLPGSLALAGLGDALTPGSIAARATEEVKRRGGRMSTDAWGGEEGRQKLCGELMRLVMGAGANAGRAVLRAILSDNVVRPGV